MTSTDASLPNITYKTYMAKPLSLKQFKLPELKSLARHYELPVSGNKPELIERIHRFFLQMHSCEKIQKLFRGHMVRYWYHLRGPASRDKTLCVNDTDFYTMDPIAEIPDNLFFSYRDDASFVYGFDITSILKLFQKSKQIMNPYNRETIPVCLAKQMISFYTISMMFFSVSNHDYSLSHRPALTSQEKLHRPGRRRNRRIPPPAIQEIMNEHVAQDPSLPAPPSQNQFVEEPVRTEAISTSSASSAPSSTHMERESRYAESTRILESMRSKSVDARVRELFIEIDQLGNYSSHRWFTELSKYGFARLYENLFIWWNVVEHIPENVNRQICGIHNVFREIHLIHRYGSVSIEKYRELALECMEAMVFTGVNDEYRKLGALYVLTILTTVSMEARNQLPWLFESLPHLANVEGLRGRYT